MKTKTIGYPFYLLTRWSRRYGIEIGHEGAGSETCYGEFMYVCMYVCKYVCTYMCDENLSVLSNESVFERVLNIMLSLC